jgi:predicted GNAT family N-acyltransferase
MALQIVPFESRKHIRANFGCGQASLDTYIREKASQDLKKRVATIFVLIDDPDTNVLAYYTLSAYTVDISAFDESFAKRLPRYPSLPATLLGRLAVNNNHKGQRFGELLLLDALKKSLDTSQQVASLAIIVEALDDQAVSFYTKYGFQQFQQEPMKLYLPMKLIEALNL